MKFLSRRIVLCGVVSILFCNLATADPEDEAAGKVKKSPPQTVDEIVGSLHDIVEHGNLADERYFSETLGVVMKGDEMGWKRHPVPCGLSFPPPKVELKLVQRFGYQDIPWYFAPYFGRNYRCNQPYVKEFLPNGLIAVQADLLLDWNKVCVTEDDFRKYFKEGIYSAERGGVVMKFSYKNKNIISMEVWTTAKEGQCVTHVFFIQNYDKG